MSQPTIPEERHSKTWGRIGRGSTRGNVYWDRLPKGASVRLEGWLYIVSVEGEKEEAVANWSGRDAARAQAFLDKKCQKNPKGGAK